MPALHPENGAAICAPVDAVVTNEFAFPNKTPVAGSNNGNAVPPYATLAHNNKNAKNAIRLTELNKLNKFTVSPTTPPPNNTPP